MYSLGRGAWARALLAKVDIRSAHRIVPVHPEDMWLLFSWYLITAIKSIVKVAGGAVRLLVGIILLIIGWIVNSDTIIASAGMLLGTTSMVVVGYGLKLILGGFCGGLKLILQRT